MKRRLFSALLIALAAASGHAQTSGSNGSHDPSRMLESEGRAWIFSTGGGSKSSSDGFVWESGPRVQPNGWAPWVNEFAPSNQGLWAPDGIYLNGTYYLYYTVCARPASGSLAPCAIGLQTTPTLNSSSSNFKWTDQGMVVSNDLSVKFAAIDAAPFLDAAGNFWVVWGGGYANPSDAKSIWVTRLDNKTGLPLTSDPGFKPPANPGYPILTGRKEGPYIHYRGGYYYLFWQTGSCCSGTSSTYQINLARSTSVTGPYTGDRVFYKTLAGRNGPGHIGIYQCGGVERFTYHYYPTAQSVVGMTDLSWGGDGWPVAGAVSTSPLKLPCATTSVRPDGPGESGSGMRVQKSAQGFRLFIPESQAGSTADVLDVHGRKKASFRTIAGWNPLSWGMLSSGLNIVSLPSGQGRQAKLIFNNGGK